MVPVFIVCAMFDRTAERPGIRGSGAFRYEASVVERADHRA
jgi:hypothetical protein